MSINDGAKTSRVKITSTFKLLTNCSGVSGAESERFIVGTVTLSAEISVESSMINKLKTFILIPSSLVWSSLKYY